MAPPPPKIAAADELDWPNAALPPNTLVLPPPNTEPGELLPPPNILPPVVGEGALVVDMLAAANILASPPPNIEL